VTNAERQAYQHELRLAAKRLGLATHGDLESAIISHALDKVRAWLAAHGQAGNLSDLLELVATSLNVEIVEIHSDADLDTLLQRIPPHREPVVARLASELDDKTDAIILQLQHRHAWERPYLAAINCRGWHSFRKYFSKWHEVVHLLLDGAQLRFAFRTTHVKRKHPEEVLVDKIAGVLAFLPDLLEPVLHEELRRIGRLTFTVVDQVRARVAPDASRHAAILACVRTCPDAVYFIRAGLGYNRSEKHMLEDALPFPSDGETSPVAKLRVRETAASPAAQVLGIRLHHNMQVPAGSVAAAAFDQPTRSGESGSESLEIWTTSQGGPVGRGEIEIEALRVGEEVWCLAVPTTTAGRTRRAH
jgi:hypothetical protein